MLRQILVPMDGSELSERALPVAQALAKAQEANVTLARVVDLTSLAALGPEGSGEPAQVQEWLDAIDSEADQELATLAERLRAQGISVKTALLHGTVGAALLDYEAQAGPDLVVMGTHGRTGPTRLMLGSVADRLVREGTVPVLLIRPWGPTEISIERALVPLDGSPLAEGALPMVEALAKRPLLGVKLVRAIEAEDDRADAESDLRQVADRLSRLGLEVQTEVRRGAALHAIEAAAEGTDLVIMATHGRGGFDRLRQGSVAEQVTRHLGAPVLLVRPGQEETPRGLEQFISSVPVFRDVDPELVASLSKFAHERRYASGDVILSEGQIGVGFFLIRSGRVEVVQRQNGREERLTVLGEGDVFGEIALLERTLRTATVRAVEPTTCVAFTGWTLRALLQESPETMERLQRVMAERLVRAGGRPPAAGR